MADQDNERYVIFVQVLAAILAQPISTCLIELDYLKSQLPAGEPSVDVISRSLQRLTKLTHSLSLVDKESLERIAEAVVYRAPDSENEERILSAIKRGSSIHPVIKNDE